MKNIKIKRILENKEDNSKLVTYYNSIKEAAESIDTKMDNWKVQMLIIDAINNKKRAFHARWEKVNGKKD